MTVAAHVGHWLADLLYVVPLILILVVLAVSRLRERRTERNRRVE